MFGPLFKTLPKELLTKILPAERAVMPHRVSKGARTALMAARSAAVVKAKGGGRRIAGWKTAYAGCYCGAGYGK